MKRIVADYIFILRLPDATDVFERRQEPGLGGILPCQPER